MSKSSANYYLWFDTEYSTVDLERAKLLQVAMVVTDARLRRAHPPEDDLNLCIEFPAEERAAPWVEQNLAPLLVKCRSAEAVTVDEADKALCASTDAIFGKPSREIRMRPVLAGNSIHADWTLVRRFLPGFLERIHYRLLDVTTVKLEWLRWFRGGSFDKENPTEVRRMFPAAQIGSDIGPHDAYYDVQASIAELAFYRNGLAKNPDAA